MFYGKIHFALCTIISGSLPTPQFSIIASIQANKSIHSHCPLCPPLRLPSVHPRFFPGSWGCAGWPEWRTAAVWNTPSARPWSTQMRCHPVGKEEHRMESAVQHLNTNKPSMIHPSSASYPKLMSIGEGWNIDRVVNQKLCLPATQTFKLHGG